MILGGVAAYAAALACPAVAQPARVLRFVPHANLSITDPMATTAFVTRNHAQMVFDTLFGLDASLTPKPQMLEGHGVSDDKLAWSFTLREGLKFHDNEPVRAADCVASLRRWMGPDPIGRHIAALTDALEVQDDRRFKLRLSRPYPKLAHALAKSGSLMPAIMPAHLAATPPEAGLAEIVGSGPFRFKRDEWVAGLRAVYEKFAGYAPRAEPGQWTSGAKAVVLDRVEWVVLPDPQGAAAALAAGEVDWWETPVADLLPTLRRNRALAVEQVDPLGNMAALRLNHLHPPFNDVRVRQAVMLSVDQAEYMRAIMGNEETLWRRLPGFFTPETPFYTEAGGEVLAGPRDIGRARAMIRDAGQEGARVVLLTATDIPVHAAQARVTAALLETIGFAVENIASDWGAVVRRRASRAPLAEGGWSAFHTWHSGVDHIDPSAYTALRANGAQAWFGWPENATVETLRDAWFDAETMDDQKRIIGELQRAALEHVVYVPTGMFYAPQAWRRTVTGIQKAPLPLFWGVAKG